MADFCKIALVAWLYRGFLQTIRHCRAIFVCLLAGTRHASRGAISGVVDRVDLDFGSCRIINQRGSCLN